MALNSSAETGSSRPATSTIPAYMPQTLDGWTSSNAAGPTVADVHALLCSVLSQQRQMQVQMNAFVQMQENCNTTVVQRLEKLESLVLSFGSPQPQRRVRPSDRRELPDPLPPEPPQPEWVVATEPPHPEWQATEWPAEVPLTEQWVRQQEPSRPPADGWPRRPQSPPAPQCRQQCAQPPPQQPCAQPPPQQPCAQPPQQPCAQPPPQQPCAQPPQPPQPPQQWSQPQQSQQLWPQQPQQDSQPQPPPPQQPPQQQQRLQPPSPQPQPQSQPQLAQLPPQQAASQPPQQSQQAKAWPEPSRWPSELEDEDAIEPALPVPDIDSDFSCDTREYLRGIGLLK